MRQSVIKIGATKICRATKQTKFNIACSCRRNFIINIQYRRHFVAIRSIETTRRELNIANHIWIYKAKSLLFARANQKWTIDLYPIYIYHVFVKVATANTVLRTQLAI